MHLDAKEAFEMRLREEKTKRFFAGIKQIKPVYNPKQWEDDYKKQVYCIIVVAIFFF